MNLPTKLTFLRIFLIPIFVAVFFIPFTGYRFVALGVFAIASFTDFLDGYLARKNNQVTNLGKFLDPIADKMLVTCALFAVTTDKVSPEILPTFTVIFAMIILCRELLVSCFRIVASSKNVILAADKWGKFKTVFQMLAMLVMIPYGSILPLSSSAAEIVYYVGFGLLAIATLLTIISGSNYIIKNKEVLKD